MRIIFDLVGLLAILAGVAVFASSKSAIHEALGVGMFMIAAILWGSSLIVTKLNELIEVIKEQNKTDS